MEKFKTSNFSLGNEWTARTEDDIDIVFHETLLKLIREKQQEK